MKNRDHFTIADLLTRYLQQSVTQEEQAFLLRWMNEREENRALVESLRDGRQIQTELNLMHSWDIDQAWEQVQAVHRRRKLKTLRVRALRWAGRAAVLLFVAGLLITKDSGQRERGLSLQSGIYHNDLEPGGNKAYLILSDGRSIDLADTLSTVNEIDGTSIIGKEGQIVYKNSGNGDESIHNVLKVPRSGKYGLTLSDGTKVWVNAGSELRYPVNFGSKERRVLIKGEAFFSVTSDSKRPFVIEVNGSTIEVLGTEFNVNAYTQEIITTLVEGKVRVKTHGRTHELSPGQESSVQGPAVHIREGDVLKATSWTRGEFYFKKDNLLSIMDEIARWYDLEVKFVGNVPRNKVYSGQISRDAQLSEVLEMLFYLTESRFELKGNKLTVILPRK